jgi:hypothetical protein
MGYIDHENLVVRRSALQSLRQMVITNNDIAKLLTEYGISSKLIAILGNASANENLKLLACSLLRCMVQ